MEQTHGTLAIRLSVFKELGPGPWGRRLAAWIVAWCDECQAADREYARIRRLRAQYRRKQR